MKQTVGVGVMVAVALAAVRYVGPQATGVPAEALRRSVPAARVTKKTLPVATGNAGGCSAYESGGTGGKEGHDPNRGEAKAVLDKFFGDAPRLPRGGAAAPPEPMKVRYAIATAPDPRHTNLALTFDRQMVLLQEAAQDDGFTYDASWMPWQNEGSAFPLLEDQQRKDDQTAEREACPGMLLFRRGVAQPKSDGEAPQPADPYGEGLVVFVVGEQPTGGLNEDQWANAVHWLAAKMPVPAAARGPKASASGAAPAAAEVPGLNVLGPTFTGSLPSLERDLAKIYADPVPAKTDAAAIRIRFPQAHLLAGGITSCSSILWFDRQLMQPRFGRRVLFGTFAENDDTQIYRFLSYLSSQATELRDVAILSEDETAYANPAPPEKLDTGNSSNGDENEPPPCAFREDSQDRPVRLSYPRDISAVRAAYDKQAIFTTRAANAARPILREEPDLESPNDQASDTIRSYSGPLSAIAQESVLYGVVTTLRTHHTRYLLLRCSNPLDFLFLTRFFHHAYPEARIVTITSDQMFSREIDTTEFRGVLALTNYPLLSRNQHWSQLSQLPDGPPVHTHRVFESNNQGIYFAGRYLFDPKLRWGEIANRSPLLLPFAENLPEFANPYWMGGTTGVEKTHAPVWLSVLGRDGYWPIAVFDEASTPQMKLPKPPQLPPSAPPSTILSVSGKEAHYALAPPAQSGGPAAGFAPSLLFTFPLSWCLAVVFALGLLLYQLFAVFSDSGLTSSGLFAPFRQIKSLPSQSVSLGLNSAFAAMLPLLLFSVGLVVPAVDYLKEPHWLEFWTAFGLLAMLGLFASLMLHREKVTIVDADSGSTHEEKRVRVRPDHGVAAWVYQGAIVLLGTTAAGTLRASQTLANNGPLFLRMTHLTSGVSPLLPMLFLFAGFYLWTWQALAGNVLLADGHPMLPASQVTVEVSGFWNRLYARLRFRPLVVPGEAAYSLGPAEFRISEALGRRILEVAGPLSLDPRVIVMPLIVGGVAIALFPPTSMPLLGMEGKPYAVWINLALLVAFLLTTAEALRLYSTWIELRRLLLALNRHPLRRTFARLRAIGQASLWSVSGSVQRTQTHFFLQQMDAARRLGMLTVSYPKVMEVVQFGSQFSENVAPRVNRGSRWEMPVKLKDGSEIGSIRSLLAEAVAEALNGLLLPYWRREQESLNLVCDKSLQTEGGEGRASLDLPLSVDLDIRAAEEFVCLQYIAFIQNVLARMRTMVLSMGVLFVAVCLAISFTPLCRGRRLASGWARTWR